MKQPKYSDNVVKFATIEQAKERYKLSRGLIMQIANDNDCVRRIGRAVRIDIQKLDKALEDY